VPLACRKTVTAEIDAGNPGAIPFTISVMYWAAGVETHSHIEIG
jgi:hypothetical protein